MYYGFTYKYDIYTSYNLKVWTSVASNLSTIMNNTAVNSYTSGVNAGYQSNWVIHDGSYFYASGYTTLGVGYHLARSTDAITWAGVGPQGDSYYISSLYYFP